MSNFEKPQAKIVFTHSGSDYEVQANLVSGTITQRLNACNDGSLVLADPDFTTLDTKISQRDLIKI